MLLRVVTTNAPCLGLQLVRTWILYGVQFNWYLTRFAYLSFSNVKAHNVCNKIIIQLSSMIKVLFFFNSVGGCCLSESVKSVVTEKQISVGIGFFFFSG